ncbi:hypothetical protein Ahy_A06g029780 [Arachis hypogaea]|uniref:Uncharacterized protein n=1 Tax=Arachis hypogaea TaxID=3818 RepID=A0A445CU85_ARAHY|nr:hypothetical protein Ahy_A06g029780 [Arachis hypogaea]
MTIHFTWFHERFRVLPADANEETVHRYACDYIIIFSINDNNENRVHLQRLPFVVRFEELEKYR